MNRYRITEYRMAPGHYETQHHSIYFMASRCWQVRDAVGDESITEHTTLRSALSAALRYDERINERRAVSR